MKKQNAKQKLNRKPDMNENDLIIEKFHTCTGVQKHLLNEWNNSDKPKKLDYGIDLNRAKRIIDEYKMNEYSKLLLNYLEFKRRQCTNQNIVSSSNLTLDGESANSIKMKSELVKFFEFVFSKGDLTSVQINKVTGSAQIKNDSLINALVELVKKEFIKRKYDITSLTIDEAERIYSDETDKKWFDEWMEQWEFFDAQDNPIDVKNFEDGKQYYSAGYNDLYDYKSVYDEMIYAYAHSHTKRRNIDIQLINQLKEELEEQNKLVRKKNGREKNRIKALIAYALADLCRIDEFLSTPELLNIDKITVSNNTGCFMHDIMSCFGIINDKTEIYGKTKTYHYTKQLLKNKKQSPSSDMQIYFRKQRLQSLKAKLCNI